MYISGIKDGISFSAGKVDLYSDFDGTYCPAKHSSLHDARANGFMDEYCARMDKFFKSTQGDIHFNITTGRTFGTYDSVSRLLKNRNFRLPFSETLITGNGSDRFVKKGTDKDFYEQGKFPFISTLPSNEKEAHIKQLTNWDSDGIHNELKRLVDKYHIRLVEADTRHSVHDYGERSLYSAGKLNAGEWKNLPSVNGHIIEHQTPVAECALGSINSGKLKLNLIFPSDYGFCPERNEIYDNFMNDLKTYMDSNNIRYHIDWEPATDHNHRRISCRITPEFENGTLNKLYDTKEAVKKAIKNNDFVITAGDGSNDFDMLNPLRYLDDEFVQKCEKFSNHKEFYRKNMGQRLKDLQKVYKGDNSVYINDLRKELTQNGFLRRLEDLPLCGIVVKKENSKLQPLIDTFASTGKIVEVESGRIDEGIKKAVKNYAKKNKSFKKAMSQSFQTLIFGTKKRNMNKIKILIGIILSGLFGYAGYKYLQNEDAKNFL